MDQITAALADHTVINLFDLFECIPFAAPGPCVGDDNINPESALHQQLGPSVGDDAGSGDPG
jgi:hypothetical protein